MFSVRRALTFGQRFISTSAVRCEAAAAGPKEFADIWAKKAASTMDLPQFPSNFTAQKSVGDSLVQGDLFPVNFFTPHSVLSQAQKDTVVLPGVDGYFGVKASHVPTIAQLKAGVIELSNGADSEKFFVSGGFVFVHPNGVTDICVLEAATLDQVDGVAVKAALAAANSSQPTDEFEQAANRAAVELYSALESALDSKA